MLCRFLSRRLGLSSSPIFFFLPATSLSLIKMKCHFRSRRLGLSLSPIFFPPAFCSPGSWIGKHFFRKGPRLSENSTYCCQTVLSLKENGMSFFVAPARSFVVADLLLPANIFSLKKMICHFRSRRLGLPLSPIFSSPAFCSPGS